MNLIPPPIYAVASFIAMWLLHKKYPIATTTAEWPVVIGCCIVAFGIAIDLLSILRFKKANTTINPLAPQKTSALLTDGLYALSRNPMYLGMAIVLTGAALILRSLSPLIMPLVFCLVVTWVQIRPEEEVLEELFDQDYRNYKRRVARWF